MHVLVPKEAAQTLRVWLVGDAHSKSVLDGWLTLADFGKASYLPSSPHCQRPGGQVTNREDPNPEPPMAGALALRLPEPWKI